MTDTPRRHVFTTDEGSPRHPARQAFRRPSRSRGYVMVMAAVISVIVLILLTGLNMTQRFNARQTVATVHKTRGLAIAEEALHKVELILRYHPSTYTATTMGQTPPGYRDDKEYDDIAGGLYKINLSSGPLPGQLTARVKAKENRGGQTRAVQAVYMRGEHLYAYGYRFDTGSLDVHWGAMHGRFGLTMNPDLLATRYPRKITRGEITGLDSDPAEPNTNHLDYWAYDTGSTGDYNWNFTSYLFVDFEYYTDRAKKSSIPLETDYGEFVSSNPIKPAIANPPGSGYFLHNDNGPQGTDNTYIFRAKSGAPPGTGYVLRQSTSVIYFYDSLAGGSIDTVVISSYTFLEVEAIIGWYNHYMLLDIHGPGGGVIGATIPVQADWEYKHPTAEPYWTTGAPSMKSVWESPNRCCYPLNNVSIHAWLNLDGYVRPLGTADPIIYGSVRAGKGVHPLGSRTLKVYFDDNTRNSFQPYTSFPWRLEWKEVVEQW